MAFAHAEHCAAQLEGRRADHRLTDLGDLDHNTSVKRALPRIVDFLDRQVR
ncbi:hypothetical protein [Streptomyces sudanensis]|uniref:hypothetical protein n=1 Tax=Streptomyces sudanensis TaxID=436397 RepID=UPI0027E4F9C0|nr:hypothetical protein [Streptomyces sudanensis]